MINIWILITVQIFIGSKEENNRSSVFSWKPKGWLDRLKQIKLHLFKTNYQTISNVHFKNRLFPNCAAFKNNSSSIAKFHTLTTPISKQDHPTLLYGNGFYLIGKIREVHIQTSIYLAKLTHTARLALWSRHSLSQTANLLCIVPGVNYPDSLLIWLSWLSPY